ncbi:MAG: DegT/DnrJ/EryC1/StrS family aminotransferase [Phycisphaerae bacterium]|nr:DegT/DnrJ/EryC1/StrS family aminotransferase [Phycisphaerae bacterium]
MTKLTCAYEREFARLVVAPQARAFALGRMGLYVVLKALGVGPGDRVGICGYSCMSVSEAVLRTGAACEFLDVDEWLNISPESLGKLPSGRIRVLITQYTFGVPSQLDKVLAWAETNGVSVVEDCCHALGSRWKGKHVGSFGSAAIYSSQWGKSYSTGQGGMLTINDADLAAKVDEVLQRESRTMSKASDISLSGQRFLRRTFVRPSTFRLLRKAYHLSCRLGLTRGSFPADIDFSNSEGFVQCAGPLLARAGLKQVRRWPKHMAARLANTEIIAEALASVGVPRLDLPPEAECVLLRYPLRRQNKPTVLDIAAKLNVDLAGWYDSPAHPLEGKQLAAIGYRGQCPNAEAANVSVIHLPTDVPISPKKLKDIATLLREPL